MISTCITILIASSPAFADQPATRPTSPTTAPTITALSPAEFQESLRTHPDYVLLDVRTPEEFSTGHLPNATLLDVRSPDFDQKVAALPRDKTYLVYCRSGHRSALACQKLTTAGLPASHLEGGITAWRQANLPATQP